MTDKEKKTILVVEDEKPLAKAACLGLEKHGYKTLTTPTADEALAIIHEKGNIDAVWLDHYLLAGHTGLDFLYELRREKKYDNIRVFVVTNSADSDKIGSYQMMNIEKYYIKAECKLGDIIEDINTTFSGEENKDVQATHC